jgi:hypothetical protein
LKPAGWKQRNFDLLFTRKVLSLFSVVPSVRRPQPCDRFCPSSCEWEPEAASGCVLSCLSAAAFCSSGTFASCGHALAPIPVHSSGHCNRTKQKRLHRNSPTNSTKTHASCTHADIERPRWTCKSNLVLTADFEMHSWNFLSKSWNSR